MKTYERKLIPPYTEIENVELLCRLCLEKVEEGVTIFPNEQDVCTAMAMRIMCCVGLEMHRDNLLPNQICKTCYEKLEKYYEFRRKCEVSYQKLKYHVMAVKKKEYENVKQAVQVSKVGKSHQTKQMTDVEQRQIDTRLVKKKQRQIGVQLVEEEQRPIDVLFVEEEQRQIDVKFVDEEPRQVDVKFIEEEPTQIDVQFVEEGQNQIDIQFVEEEQRQIDIQFVEEEQNQIDIQFVEEEQRQTEVQLAEEEQTQIDIQDVEQGEKDDEQLVIQFGKPEIMNVPEKVVDMEEVQLPLELESPDIASFLSGALMELGVLEQKESGLVLQQDIQTLQLETGSGEQLVMQLVEEEDEVVKTKPDLEVKEESKSLLIERTNNNKPKSKQEITGGGAWCGICARAFSSRSACARHARTHAGQRPHRCTNCSATFAQRSVLRRHQLVHLEVRPHKCTLCTKSFTQRGALLAHARTHDAARAHMRLHPCTLCDKVFLYSSGLSRHMLQHNGLTYTCTVCEKRFNDRSSFVRHSKSICRENSGGRNRRGAGKLARKVPDSTAGQVKPNEGTDCGR